MFKHKIQVISVTKGQLQLHNKREVLELLKNFLFTHNGVLLSLLDKVAFFQRLNGHKLLVLFVSTQIHYSERPSANHFDDFEIIHAPLVG